MKLRTVTAQDIALIDNALAFLRVARRSLSKAGAKNSARYVARAIKSAEGAQNHAQRAYAKQERTANPRPHVKIKCGQCRVCGHYGDDCTGTAA